MVRRGQNADRRAFWVGVATSIMLAATRAARYSIVCTPTSVASALTAASSVGAVPKGSSMPLVGAAALGVAMDPSDPAARIVFCLQDEHTQGSDTTCDVQLTGSNAACGSGLLC